MVPGRAGFRGVAITASQRGMRFRRCRLDDALRRAPQPLPDGRRSHGRLAERVAPAQNAPAGTLAGSMAANTALPGTNLSELAGHSLSRSEERREGIKR